MINEITSPNINAGNDTAKINQIVMYLSQLKDDLNTFINCVSENNLSPELQKLLKGIQDGLSKLKMDSDNRAGFTLKTSNGVAMLEADAEKIKLSVSDLKTKTSELTVTADGIKQSVTNLETNTRSSFDVMSNAIAAKVSRGAVVAEINMSPEQVKIAADKIALEGLVTVNGGFQVDENGNVTIANENATVRMAGTAIKISFADGRYCSVSPAGILFGGGTAGIYQLCSFDHDNGYIVLGVSNKRIKNAYFEKINGSTPVTESNISDYALPISGGTLTGNLYLPGNPSSSVDERIAWLKSEIVDLRSRIAALEG